MIRRSLGWVTFFAVATWAMGYITPVAYASNTVTLLTPSATIPEAPGSIAATGKYSGPDGTILVEIFKAVNDPVEGWIISGDALSSAATAVSASTGNPWAANPNSPADGPGQDYMIRATYKNTAGTIIREAGPVHIKST